MQNKSAQFIKNNNERENYKKQKEVLFKPGFDKCSQQIATGNQNILTCGCIYTTFRN